MKKNLLPTDFSVCARNAVDYAFALFGFEDTEYILLNTYIEPIMSAEMIVPVDGVLQQASHSGLSAEMKYLSAKYQDHTILLKKCSKSGDLSYIINQVDEVENIDFVVMGTKGASGIKKILIGSNASAVAINCNNPVLTVPEKISFTPLSQIGFADDSEYIDNQTILFPLRDMAEKFKSHISVIHIQSDDEDVNTDVSYREIGFHNALKSIPHTFHFVEGGNTVKKLNDIVQELNIDILALVGHPHNFFARIFKGSISEEMTMLSEIPLLVLHN